MFQQSQVMGLHQESLSQQGTTHHHLASRSLPSKLPNRHPVFPSQTTTTRRSPVLTVNRVVGLRYIFKYYNCLHIYNKHSNVFDIFDDIVDWFLIICKLKLYDFIEWMHFYLFHFTICYLIRIVRIQTSMHIPSEWRAKKLFLKIQVIYFCNIY